MKDSNLRSFACKAPALAAMLTHHGIYSQSSLGGVLSLRSPSGLSLLRQGTIIQLDRLLPDGSISSHGRTRTPVFSTRLSTPTQSPVSPLGKRYRLNVRYFTGTHPRLVSVACISPHGGWPLTTRLVLVAPTFLTHLPPKKWICAMVFPTVLIWYDLADSNRYLPA